MKKLGTILGLSIAGLALIFAFSACNLDLFAPKGTMSLSLTDAPIDADNVSGVYITITGIQYNRSMDGQQDEGSWVTMEEFEGPAKYNLLELTGGESELLGELVLPAGQYNQIRFMLDIPEQGGQAAAPSNPGCYIEYTDGTTEALFVPSGGQTGYKATGAFQVPENGTVEITADFDARKAVVSAGASGLTILKPTIRLVVENEAGRIGGTVSGYTAGNDLVVYAYEDAAYDAAVETADPAEGESRFPNAVTSSKVAADGAYGLWFLAAGTYDVVVAEYSDGTFLEAAELASDVAVEAGTKTTKDIDASSMN
jgi:hypothetical protein